MKPNLFSFATSELSQDAVLCWLLSWADPSCVTVNASLNHIAVQLIQGIYQKLAKPFPESLKSVKVRRQVHSIDIFCVINETDAVLIEDKTGTQQHSNQLERYKAVVVEKLHFQEDRVLPIYIQTGDQSDYSEATKHGYSILTRRDLLNVFEFDEGKSAASESDIFGDFVKHLKSIEDDVQSFISVPLQDWSWNAWRGFYSYLQETMGEGHWQYVANPNGGFLGFWWYFREVVDCEPYLQLEQGTFCFKIGVDDDQDRSAIRNRWHDLVKQNAPKHGLEAERPWFGRGQYMTVATLKGGFPLLSQDGRVDLDASVKALKLAQLVLDDCVTQASA